MVDGDGEAGEAPPAVAACVVGVDPPAVAAARLEAADDDDLVSERCRGNLGARYRKRRARDPGCGEQGEQSHGGSFPEEPASPVCVIGPSGQLGKDCHIRAAMDIWRAWPGRSSLEA